MCCVANFSRGGVHILGRVMVGASVNAARAMRHIVDISQTAGVDGPSGGELFTKQLAVAFIMEGGIAMVGEKDDGGEG